MVSISSYSSSPKLRAELDPLHLSAITSCALPGRPQIHFGFAATRLAFLCNVQVRVQPTSVLLHIKAPKIHLLLFVPNVSLPPLRAPEGTNATKLAPLKFHHFVMCKKSNLSQDESPMLISQLSGHKRLCLGVPTDGQRSCMSLWQQISVSVLIDAQQTAAACNVRAHSGIEHLPGTRKTQVHSDLWRVTPLYRELVPRGPRRAAAVESAASA